MELEQGLSVGDSEQGNAQLLGSVVQKSFNINTHSTSTFIYWG